MDVVALQKKKKVRVLEHTPAVLSGYRLVFSQQGPQYVEPAYAGLKKEVGSEVHGIAFCMGKESVEELDKTEAPKDGGYGKETVTLNAYGGRELVAYTYVPNMKSPFHEVAMTEEEYLPSERYKGIMCKGAEKLGLAQSYLTMLGSLPTYSSATRPEVLQARAEREKARDGLKLITREELAGHKTDSPWISCLGFVVNKYNWFLGSHKGRDITSRVLMQFHGIPLDDNDDGGFPPYPLVSCLSAKELEYVTSWLDFYHVGLQGDLVGFLKEFKEEQDKGATNFVLPPVPE